MGGLRGSLILETDGSTSLYKVIGLTYALDHSGVFFSVNALMPIHNILVKQVHSQRERAYQSSGPGYQRGHGKLSSRTQPLP